MITLVSGLEQIEGFDTWVENIPRDVLNNRLGQRFPLIPELDQKGTEQMVADGIGWTATTMFPSLALPSWRLETPDRLDVNEPIRHNTNLYHFLSEVRARLDRLARGLNRCAGTVMSGGCYVAGTGRDTDRDHAFLPGVLVRLTDEQDNVTWTDTAFEEEDRYRHLTRGGYITLAVVVLLGLAAIAYRVLLS